MTKYAYEVYDHRIGADTLWTPPKGQQYHTLDADDIEAAMGAAKAQVLAEAKECGEYAPGDRFGIALWGLDGSQWVIEGYCRLEAGPDE